MSQSTIGIVSKCAIPLWEVPVRTPDRPTIADVAAAAGVGVGTVSRVLNGGVNVRESTRLKVLGSSSGWDTGRVTWPPRCPAAPRARWRSWCRT